MTPELSPELLETIFKYILADLEDTTTLRACSLAFPHHTNLFQRALCSRKPLILSFNQRIDPHGRNINRLVELLQVNPRFGSSLGPEVRFHFSCRSPKPLSDPRVAKIARCCSGMDSGIVSLTIYMVASKGRRIRWADFSEENREALEGIIAHSPRLQTLKLLSIEAPWTVLLLSRPFLESLHLRGACPSTPTLPWSIPLPVAKSDDPGFKPIRIGWISASTAELHTLSEATFCGTPDVNGKDFPSYAIDFGHLRGIAAACDNDEATGNLRQALHRASQLEELTLQTFNSEGSPGTLKGLFSKPHSDYLFHLRHLEFVTSDQLSPQSLPTIVGALSQLPPNNILETLLVEGLVSPYSGHVYGNLVLKEKGEIMVLLEVLTRCRFPSLNKVTLTIAVLIVNGSSISSDARIRQLTEYKEELEGMKWDFGSLSIDIREHQYRA